MKPNGGKNIPGNFKDKYRREKKSHDQDEGLICPHCQNGQLFTQTHVLSCSEWTEIRKDLKMHSISGLVTFFKRLLVEKEKKESGR